MNINFTQHIDIILKTNNFPKGIYLKYTHTLIKHNHTHTVHTHTIYTQIYPFTTYIHIHVLIHRIITHILDTNIRTYSHILTIHTKSLKTSRIQAVAYALRQISKRTVTT